MEDKTVKIKYIWKLCLTIAMSVMVLFSMASAADNNIDTHASNSGTWVVSSRSTSSRSTVATKNGTNNIAYSSCVSLTGSTTVNGNNTKITVTYQAEINNIITNVNGTTYITGVCGKTKGTLSSTVPTGSAVYGRYKLSNYGAATTATGYTYG